MTTTEIETWLKRNEGVHGKEIAIRVDEARKIFCELLKLRTALEYVRANHHEGEGVFNDTVKAALK